MKSIIKIAFLLFAINTFGQSTFEKRYGNSYNDFGCNAIQTFDKGFVIAGKKYINDVIIIKTDTSGNEVWKKNYACVGHHKEFCIKQTSDSGFVIVGSTNKPSVYLLRLNKNGDTLWTKTYGNKLQSYGYSLVQSNNGGFLITGKAIDSSVMKCYPIILNIDANGNLKWFKTFKLKNKYAGKWIERTKDNNYIVLSESPEFTDVSTCSNLLLLKIDESGDTLWTKKIENNCRLQAGNVIPTNDDGYLIIATSSDSNLTNKGKNKFSAYLIKTDKTGTIKWKKNYSENGNTYGKFICKTSDSCFVFVANTWRHLDVDYMYYLDLMIVKVDKSGILIWKNNIETDGYLDPISIHETEDKGFVIGGTVNDNELHYQVLLLKVNKSGKMENK